MLTNQLTSYLACGNFLGNFTSSSFFAFSPKRAQYSIPFNHSHTPHAAWEIGEEEDECGIGLRISEKERVPEDGTNTLASAHIYSGKKESANVNTEEVVHRIRN